MYVEPTDLVALVQRVVTRLQMTTDRHTLSVSTVVEHLVAPVDPRRIEQVLSNLIGNAIKYSPEGGPIEISMREGVGVETAFISIRDAGIGIPAHQQTLIFGRFARADNARAYGLGGTGLGLYLCRELTSAANSSNATGGASGSSQQKDRARLFSSPSHSPPMQTCRGMQSYAHMCVAHG